MENKDEIKAASENGFTNEPPKFYFPSELEGSKKEDKAPSPTPEREHRPSGPTNIFGNSAILNIPELKKDDPAPKVDEPTVDSIYDGPPKAKRIALVLIPLVALLLVFAIALSSLLIVLSLNKPDRSEYLFDAKGLLGVKSSESPTLWGFINESGDVVIDYQFLDVKPFTEVGLAAVKVNNGSRWGYINTHGDIVIDTVFIEAYPFDAKGFAVVKDENGNYGMINKHGDYVVEPEYRTLSPFNEFGVAYTDNGLIFRDNFKMIKVGDNARISAFSTDGYASLGDGRLINKNGKIIKIVQSIEASGILPDHSPVEKSNDNAAYSKVSASSIQKPVIDKEYFANDLVWVCFDGKYGYINDKFEIAIDCKFKSANPFSSNGLAGVQFEDGTYGYINKKGETVISLAKYSNISSLGDFSDTGFATVSFGAFNGGNIVYGDSLSPSSSVVWYVQNTNVLNEDGEFLFDEPLGIGTVRELGDKILVRSRTDANSSNFVLTAYNKSGEAAWSIECATASITAIFEESFLLGGALYSFDGELIADLSEYGNGYSYCHFQGNSLDYIIFIAYEALIKNENHYFVFDHDGKLILDSPMSGYRTPSFFADGYITLSQDTSNEQTKTIGRFKGGEFQAFIKTNGYVAYDTVTSYFENGRHGSGYYYGGLYSGSSFSGRIVDN